MRFCHFYTYFICFTIKNIFFLTLMCKKQRTKFSVKNCSYSLYDNWHFTIILVIIGTPNLILKQ